MISDAYTIAGDAFRDATRRKGVVYLLLLIAIAQVSVFSLYGEISLGIEDKMLMDASLGMVYLVGLVSAFSVAFQVPRELRERTAMTLFAKPMGRESYLVGKVLGGSALAFRNMLVVALGSLFILSSKDITNAAFTVGYFQSFVLALVAAVDVIAISLLLSIFLSEGAVVIGAIISIVLGNATYMMSNSESGMATIAAALKYVLPNFFLLDIKTEVAAGLSSSMPYVASSAAYGVAYAVMLTSLCVLLFKRRDL